MSNMYYNYAVFLTDFQMVHQKVFIILYKDLPHSPVPTLFSRLLFFDACL